MKNMDRIWKLNCVILKATKHRIIAIAGWLARYKECTEDVKYYVQSFTVL